MTSLDLLGWPSMAQADELSCGTKGYCVDPVDMKTLQGWDNDIFFGNCS